MNEASPAYQPVPDPVTDGQTCSNCGYDLMGLVAGSPCPECGPPIAGKRRKLSKLDSIADASRAHLRSLSLSLFAMGTAGLVIATMLGISIALPAIDYTVRFFGSILTHTNYSGWLQQTPQGIWPAVISAGVILLCVVYAASSIIVYLPRKAAKPQKSIKLFGTEWTALRRIAVGSQCAWVLVPLLGIAEIYAPGHAIRWVAALVLLAAIAGIAPAAWLLSDIANWSNNNGVAMRLRASVCIMGIGAAYIAVALVLLAIGSGAGLVMVLFSWIFGVLLMLGVLVYFVSALQLSATAHWAIINANQESQRDARMAERAHKRAQQAAAHPQEVFPTAVPKHLADEVERKSREAEQDPDLQRARELIGRSQKKVIGRENAEAYTLEEDENPDPDA